MNQKPEARCVFLPTKWKKKKWRNKEGLKKIGTKKVTTASI